MEKVEQAAGADEKKERNAGKKHAFDLMAKYFLVRQLTDYDIKVRRSLSTFKVISDNIFDAKLDKWNKGDWDFNVD